MLFLQLLHFFSQLRDFIQQCHDLQDVLPGIAGVVRFQLIRGDLITECLTETLG